MRTQMSFEEMGDISRESRRTAEKELKETLGRELTKEERTVFMRGVWNGIRAYRNRKGLTW